MKYTRLSLKNITVFVFVFAAAFLFFLAPRQAIGAGTLIYGWLYSSPGTESCSFTGNTSIACFYGGVGDYTMGWQSSSLRTPICTFSASHSPIVPHTGSPVCLVAGTYCYVPKVKSPQNECIVHIMCSGQSVTYDQPTNTYLIDRLPVDAGALYVICVQ